ncbi:MAG TPA: DUF4234 domain-containing protein [Mycobacteriales bacterium]|nr:DUF4234 domain-containing protein [Mycobacteriales bacterium]
MSEPTAAPQYDSAAPRYEAGPPAPPYQPPPSAPPYQGAVVTYGPVRLSSGTEARLRSPVLVAVFTIITLGVYQIVWWYQVNREMAEHGQALGRTELGHDPARSTLALFPGAILAVPAIWTTVTTFQRIQAAQRLHRRVPVNGWLGLVLAIVFSPALLAYMQSGLNSAWSAATPGRP